MSAEETTFEESLALTDSESQDISQARVSATWAQGRAAYGGLVAGLMARALERQIPAARTLRSALIDFVAPVAPGEVTIETRVLRAGRALTHGEARFVQNGQLCALLVGTYGETRATSLHFVEAGPPTLGPAEQLSRLPYIDGLMPRFTKQFEFRVSGDRIPFSGSTRANLNGYVRHQGGGPVDAAGVLGLLDAWAPAISPLLKKFAPLSTATWMVDIVGELPARGTSSDAFYRYDAEGVAAEGGYGSCEARLWGPDGKLLAASRQMVVEFS